MSEANTQERRSIHKLIENGGMTMAMVSSQKGEKGLSRLAKHLLNNDYVIAGAPAPLQIEKPLEPHSENKVENRRRRLQYARRVLSSTAADTVIEIKNCFRPRIA